MYWHASEFYLATDDVKQALDLLQKDVSLRPNSTSWVALARAQLAAGHLRDEASIDKALAMPVVSALLFWTASRIYRSAGDAASSEKFRARAEGVNPKIAQEDHDEEARDH
jgi:hypothetical protein